MDIQQSIGVPPLDTVFSPRQMMQFINLKLNSLGCAPVEGDDEWRALVNAVLPSSREIDRLLSGYLCPSDYRIQKFLDRYLEGCSEIARLPQRSFLLNQHGLARALSLPHNGDEFISEIVSSYRIRQGVLHNPAKDRRTTQGVFHIAEGGLPIPADKIAVPKEVFARLLHAALNPPRELLLLPITANQKEGAHCFVSLLLRPVVAPEVNGYSPEKSLETRFFAPGSLVSNLDFVESIFGNAGDPFLPHNDAALAPQHWTGHTGCVILAPHLTTLTKKELGMPHESDDEKYNGGQAFKITARDESGVMVTLIADNYFGYCKKEIKTQISFSANLQGWCEEEHAGGALVYPAYDLGETFSGDLHVPRLHHSFEEVCSLYGAAMTFHDEGHATDKKFPNIVYIPENAAFDLNTQRVSWPHEDGEKSIRLLPDKTYMRPSGYKILMEKPPGGRAWRLVGAVGEGTLCHKPSTVSGGGKSEISKPISDAIIQGPVFVADFERDFDEVQKLIERDYAGRFSADHEAHAQGQTDSRPILSAQRSLGSVIKLLTPERQEYSREYNEWLDSIPQHIKELVFVVKRFYKPEWGENWRAHFSVDAINGQPGNELRFDNHKLVSNYLRVGYERDGSQRTFGLRKDFHPAWKRQVEDDITASIVVPTEELKNLNPHYRQPAVKFVHNCEYRLFQRPDDAIHRGYDRQAEADLAAPNNFLSNYQPLNAADARALIEDSIGFDKFTVPMQKLILESATGAPPNYFVSSANPRIVDGTPSKNPRYLQTRQDLIHPQDVYLADMATRMYRRLPLDAPLYTPVNAVLPGRRNNPPSEGVRSLAVYNPIHHMELPELFMEFICSMTGKSPSTTGAGSEGALTKGPFNALLPIYDLNHALLSYVLTGYDAFLTSAGYVGPKLRVDHDISLLVPEIWCRMTVREREPEHLIGKGYLEKCEDFEHNGKLVPASMLGYRITRRFAGVFGGRVFTSPHAVFTDEMLQPELQDFDIFADGMSNIVETQARVAAMYFEDGGIEAACPPLRALLHIMRDGSFEGKDREHPKFRALFSRENLLGSEWYARHQETLRERETAMWRRHVSYLEKFLAQPRNAEEAARLNLAGRLEMAKEALAKLETKSLSE